MTTAGLNFINGCLEDLGVPYEFMEWTSDIADPYFVGQTSEIPNPNEDGMIETDLLLIGTTKSKYLELLQINETIRDAFPEYGLTEILSNGWGIAVMYEKMDPIPSIDESVHRIQITLKVKEWKGN